MTLISSTPFIPHSFEDVQHGVFPNPLGEEMYAQWCRTYAKMKHVSITRITYESDGLAIQGFKLLPAEIPSDGLPLVIFNRGGMQRFGMIVLPTLLGLLIPLVEMGYMVLASQYRGNDGSEGREEWGGDDVNDVLNLLELGKTMPEWNGAQAYMLGWSRGGMMTYLALKAGAQVQAAASIAGAADLMHLAAFRPEMVDNVFKKLIPHTDESSYKKELIARSAVEWAEDINVPLHLQHGDADDRVDVQDSRKLAAALEAAGKPHQLVIHKGGDHFMTRSRDDIMNNAHNWFKAHP
jgi:dipeptidyl aminopeptidase/acylaminoacyl peptidase